VAPEEVFTVRTYATNAPYEATASAQICTRTTVKTQVNELQNPPTRNSDKSQVWDLADMDAVMTQIGQGEHRHIDGPR